MTGRYKSQLLAEVRCVRRHGRCLSVSAYLPPKDKVYSGPENVGMRLLRQARIPLNKVVPSVRLCVQCLRKGRLSVSHATTDVMDLRNCLTCSMRAGSERYIFTYLAPIYPPGRAH